MLPRTADEWSDDRIRIVLCHELAHVRRNDWAIQMLAELVRSVYWFNPLVWIACRQLREQSEHACDDAVLNHGIAGSEYAAHLVSLARLFEQSRKAWAPAPAMARLLSLEKRVGAMLNERLNHTPMKKSIGPAIAIALLSITVPIAGFGEPAQKTDSVQEVSSGSLSLSLAFGRIEETILVSQNPEARHAPSISEPLANLKAHRTNLAVQPGPLHRQRNADPCSTALTGGCVSPPVALRRVQPQYPQDSRDARPDVRVIVDGRIGTDGFLTALRLVTVPSEFADSVLEALQQWQFESARLNGVPVESDITVTVDFR